jgi:hypothetical protein
MADRNETWALPGLLLGAVGVVAIVTGFMADGPDRVGGLVFGGVALLAAAVILWRRTPRRPGTELPEDAEPGAADGAGK